MEEKKTHSTLAIASGVSFALFVLILLSRHISYNNGSSYDTLELFVLLGLAVTLLLEKRKWLFGLLIATTLLRLIQLIEYEHGFSLRLFLAALTYALLALLIFLSLRERPIARKCWFIPVISAVLWFFLSTVPYGYFQEILFYRQFILMRLLEFLGLVFLCLWVKCGCVPGVSVSRSQAHSNSVAACIGNADKLKMYKSLLDHGAITEEEFQAKKAELLK